MSEHDYLSRYSLQFASQLDELGWRVYDRVVSSVENLEHNPRLGRLYVPQYQASPIPMPCRCLYVHGTTKVLYYTVDDDAQTLDFFCIGDARSDPRRRFEDMD